MPPTTGYRFTLPPDEPFGLCNTNSFGIEPIGVNSKGKTVKTGKAIIRIVIRSGCSNARSLARAIALAISDHLNTGGTYAGPKTINIDRVFHMMDTGKINGWLI